MRYLVYDVAAESGGALSVLKEHYAKAVDDRDNEYLFLTSGLYGLDETENIKIKVCPWAKKNLLTRLFYDVFYAPLTVKRSCADRVISLQNTVVNFISLPQTVYYHNALPKPFCDYRFSFKEDFLLWKYQNIIGPVFCRSLKKANKIVVQSQWLKKRCVEKLGINPQRILVESPHVDAPNAESFYSDEVRNTFFYPSSYYEYKNHKVILEAMNAPELKGDDFKVVLTLKDDELAAIVNRHALTTDPERLELSGWLDSQGLSEVYGKSILVFPSLVESYGLPLAEAASYGCPIIAADLEYAHETLSGYKNVWYFNPLDSSSLAQAMHDVLKGDVGIRK